LVTPGENGFHFPAGDATALGEAMRRFVENPQLCEKMAAVSRARAEAWTPERGAERWVEALRKVTA
jgi:glycosyltransferase involved in cell wall biosynthesis